MHAIYKNTSEIHIKLAPNAIRRARAGLFLGVSGAEFIGKTQTVAFISTDSNDRISSNYLFIYY